MKDYSIAQDIMYINFIRSKPTLSDTTKKQYRITLSKFTEAIQQPLIKIIQTCKEQQEKIIEKTTSQTTDENGNTIIEKSITKFDVNNPDSYINLYLNTYIQYCKNKNNKNNTINSNIILISAVLSYYGVEIPTLEKFSDDSEKWYLLSKEDFKYVINDSSITHASLIKFLMSSGMRISDALSLTIGDFMQATSEYHNFVEVNDFIDNAPSDMIGSWSFHPSKTQKYNIECQTFNDPESSNLILQNLRRIKNEYNPRKNIELGLKLEPSKNDALFGSQKAYFKGHIPGDSVADRFWQKNKKLKEYHINKIKQDIKDGLLSAEDYEKEVNKIPKFHAHACRKYFETMISKNCGDLRICTLLEGHVPPVKTDSSYIKIDYEQVKEAYLAALPDLSLENTETKVYTSDIRREMEQKITVLERELESKTNEVKVVNDRVDSIEKILGDLGIESIVDKVKKE